jgi:hypothetical protein
MSHEPECDDFQNGNSDGDCICHLTRHAYDRGREDIFDIIAQVMKDTPPNRRSLGVQDLMNRIEEAIENIGDDND